VIKRSVPAAIHAENDAHQPAIDHDGNVEVRAEPLVDCIPMRLAILLAPRAGVAMTSAPVSTAACGMACVDGTPRHALPNNKIHRTKRSLA
jgi:hypothetical protein